MIVVAFTAQFRGGFVVVVAREVLELGHGGEVCEGEIKVYESPECSTNPYGFRPNSEIVRRSGPSV